MLKDEAHQSSQSQLMEDLQFMLSSIRARQNGLIFFLQRLKNQASLNSSEFKLTKNQFQQKQKIYSTQINKIIQKHSQSSSGKLYAVRSFWIKLKTIIKVSIQRVQTMNISETQKLRVCYQKALSAITRNSQGQKSLIGYKEVENYLKKRNIEATLLGRQAVSPSSISYSESKIQKNRSQTLFKPQSAVSRFAIQNNDSHIYSKGQTLTLASKDRANKFQLFNGLAGIQEENLHPKIKSLNRIKNRRPDQIIKTNILNFIKISQVGKLKSSAKASQKYIKKINKHVDKYQKNFDGAFDGKYEISNLLDKKKTIIQNIYSIYDDLFAKNIPNHKMISKFMFNTTKINQIIYNAYEKKKKMAKKQKSTNNDTKDLKQKDINHKKHKDKQAGEQKQKHIIIKSTKNNRKLHSAKDFHHIEMNQINTTNNYKEYFRQKKESQTTAITLKNPKENINSQKIQKEQKEKEKYQRQKKIQRSKTAKIKLNSQIQNPQIQIFAQNIFSGKHFVSQKDSKGSQKLVKIGV